MNLIFSKYLDLILDLSLGGIFKISISNFSKNESRDFEFLFSPISIKYGSMFSFSRDLIFSLLVVEPLTLNPCLIRSLAKG